MFYSGLFSPASANPASHRAIATDKDPKPDNPFFNSPRITFDCTALDTLEIQPAMIDTLQGDTTGGPTNLPGYSCAPWYEEGPEHIYRLDVLSDLELFAGLRDMGDQDLDIFLLNDCDTDSCLVGANTELSIQLTTGTYYLIVDGAGSGSNVAAGPYKVALETRYLGVPPQICEPDFCEPVTCGIESASFSDDLFGQANLVQTFDCSNIIERGGEAWFAVTLEGKHDFSAKAHSLHSSLDAALWIFDSCGPDAQCLAFVDDAIAGGEENIEWINDTQDEITVFLALDSYHPVSQEFMGTYTLDFTCVSNVPTEKTSWGSVRALYRQPRK
ncbi:MAG: hypothetical protein GY780_01355 [bacterium]|nr:hypothetical protein [bacterium]